MRAYKDPLGVSPSSSQGGDKFTEGPPSSGLSADWLESLREEIEGMIHDSQGSLDKNDNTQLKATILALTGGGLAQQSKLTSSDDLDNVTTPGVYYWGSGSEPSNVPFAGDDCSMIVTPRDDKALQRVYNDKGDKIAVRGNDGSWASWNKFT